MSMAKAGNNQVNGSAEQPVGQPVGQPGAVQQAEVPRPPMPEPKRAPKSPTGAKKGGKGTNPAKKTVKPKATEPNEDSGAKTGGRLVRSFPACTFEEALEIAKGIQQHASGHSIRRLTLFHELGKSAESGGSRQAITNSGRYGLTAGGYQRDHLSLTPDGNAATSPDSSPAERLRARFRLAIENIAPFKALYERYKGKLPSQTVMRDFLIDS